MGIIQLVPVKRNFFSNVKEWLQSKIDKNYILTSSSPKSLMNNNRLIIKTLRITPNFLDNLSDELLSENDNFLNVAIESGYQIRSDSRFKNNVDFIFKYIDIAKRLPPIYALDNEIFENSQLREKFLEQAKKEHFLLSRSSPQFLREDKELAINYYTKLLAKDNEKINLSDESILNINLISDESFLKDFINLCNEKNIDKQNILDNIINVSGATNFLKNNPQIINLIFNKLEPENLREFFDKIQISEKELEMFFNNNFTGNLEELSEIYKKNPMSIDTFSGKLLGKGIPLFKLQEYSGDEKFQKELLSLSQFRYKLFEKITNKNLQKTYRWNRTEYMVLRNLSKDAFYEELLNNLLIEAQNGNKITEEEIETLTKLFSEERGMSAKEMEEEGTLGWMKPKTNNSFCITNKNELKYYEKIKQTVCDIIITNPNLENNEEVKKFDKYLQYFKTLEPIDRLKLAILRKTFGMDINNAKTIMMNFGNGIDKFKNIDENTENIVEQIKAIRNILNCNDIEILQEVGQMIEFVDLDLSQSTLLFDDAKEVFEKDLKKDLYSPKKEDFVEFYEEIEIYQAPLEFEAITKFSNEEPNKNMWKSSYSSFDGKNNFRRKSCMSFTNGELLNPTDDGFITFGFGKSIQDFQFGGMFLTDAHSNMAGDPIYWGMDEENSQYRDKDNFITETIGEYNEIIVDTLTIDDSLEKNKKLMPEYIIYYQKNSDMKKEERDKDLNWKNAIKAAKEFGVPVVVIDCEAIRKNELKKIKEGINENNTDYKSVKRLVGQINHYKYRYKENEIKEVTEISELISDEELAEKEKFLEEYKLDNEFDIKKYTNDDNIKQKIESNTKFLEGVGIVER